jgi:hypothetical protein
MMKMMALATLAEPQALTTTPWVVLLVRVLLTACSQWYLVCAYVSFVLCGELFFPTISSTESPSKGLRSHFFSRNINISS